MTPTVISLGTLCHMTRILERLHWRQASYPFDWVFTSPQILHDIISTDFQDFLNPEYYCNVKHSQFGDRSAGHKKYHEDFFGHKNPRTPEDYEYYVRCVERFRDMLTTTKPKIFMMLYSPENTRHPEDYANMSRIHQEEYLASGSELIYQTLRNVTDNFRVVTLNVCPSYRQDFHRVVISHQEILTIHTLTCSTGRKFDDGTYTDGVHCTDWHPDNLYVSGLLSELYPLHRMLK